MSLEKSKEIETPISDDFSEYGLEVLENGLIHEFYKPPKYSKTPKFKIKESGDIFSSEEKDFLQKNFLGTFSTYENKETILAIADKIVKEIIGESYEFYANIIIMKHEDFQRFKNFLDMGEITVFHGINLGGLVINEDSDGSNCFPIIFHEIGHNFYPDEELYENELRAYYFQILCVKKLEQLIQELGINGYYKDDYYEDTPLPSETHRKAFQDARLLYTFQCHYDMIVKESERAIKIQEDLLAIVKQDTVSI